MKLGQPELELVRASSGRGLGEDRDCVSDSSRSSSSIGDSMLGGNQVRRAPALAEAIKG